MPIARSSIAAAMTSLCVLFASMLTLLIPGAGSPGLGLAFIWILIPVVSVGVLVLAPTFWAIDLLAARLRVPLGADLALSALCGALGIALWFAVTREPLMPGVVAYGAFAGLVGRAVQRSLNGRRQAQRI